MKLLRNFTIIQILLSVIIYQSCTSGEISQGRPSGVILMIGDGMGITQVYAGMTANMGSLNIEQAEYIGLQKTYSANNYITDSGASGTAMASGIKTRNGAIGVDSSGQAFKNIVEYAEESGLYTGVIATSTITHATPAAFVSHNMSRGEYEEIAADFVDAGLELIIGGGWAHFRCREDGRNLLQEMESLGYSVSEKLDEAGNSLPLIILTDSMAMPPAHLGRGELLADATSYSLKQFSSNRKGFFLMVEGSQIDWAGHDNDTEYLVSEMIDFDKAIGEAIDFARNRGDVLVIVTADHETGGVAAVSGNISTGELELEYISDHHTGVMVPVFAYGPGAEEFAGIYENTAIFDKIMDLLDLR